MVTRLKVKKTGDGEIGVSCPACEGVVIPIHSPELQFWDCPDCGQPFDPLSLKAYRNAVDEQARRDEFGDRE